MTVSRRKVQTVLGVLWFLDGLMQLKPPMFTTAFLSQVILPTAQLQPLWISGPIRWVAHVTAPHIALFDTLFAVIQLAIGLGLIFNFRVKGVLTVSFLWTFLVWWFGEGLGQLLTGQSLILTGAPGAVLLYGLVGLAVWPASDSKPTRENGFGEHQIQFARWALGVLWILGGLLHFQPDYLTPKGLAGAVALPWIGQMMGSNSMGLNIALGVLEFGMGVFLLMNVRVVPIVWVSIILSLIYWWVGQDFGQLFTGLGTDPNAGPLYIVLALCASPHSFSRERRAVQPT